MPRTKLVTRLLPSLAIKRIKADVDRQLIKGPRLYNAKRLVQVSQSSLWRNPAVTARILTNLKHNVHDESWRPLVSNDVAEFIDDMEDQGTKLLPEEQMALLQNPVKYFSRPQNVPTSVRQQVYFPDFPVILVHQKMGPNYAKFKVPLWFSKIDLKCYLKEVYQVDVVHIRSTTSYAYVKRVRHSPVTRGGLQRGVSQKKMIVQLVEPFTWPAAEVEQEDRRKNKFFNLPAVEKEERARVQDQFGQHLDKKHRKLVAEQAASLLTRKTVWSPTWQHLPQSRKMMLGNENAASNTASKHG